MAINSKHILGCACIGILLMLGGCSSGDIVPNPYANVTNVDFSNPPKRGGRSINYYRAPIADVIQATVGALTLSRYRIGNIDDSQGIILASKRREGPGIMPPAAGSGPVIHKMFFRLQFVEESGESTEMRVLFMNQKSCLIWMGDMNDCDENAVPHWPDSGEELFIANELEDLYSLTAIELRNAGF